VIMEYAGKCGRAQAEETIRSMVEEAFEIRGIELADVKIASTEYQVETVGCALAAVPLWY
jgi:arginine decarboxylase